MFGIEQSLVREQHAMTWRDVGGTRRVYTFFTLSEGD